jgi:hypothetical protein
MITAIMFTPAGSLRSHWLWGSLVTRVSVDVVAKGPISAHDGHHHPKKQQRNSRSHRRRGLRKGLPDRFNIKLLGSNSNLRGVLGFINVVITFILFP